MTAQTIVLFLYLCTNRPGVICNNLGIFVIYDLEETHGN